MAYFSLNPSDALFSFVSLILEGMPFLVIGSLVSGIVAAFVSSKQLERLLPKKIIPAIFISGLFGSFMPMCECGVIPVVRRLLSKGLPIAVGITFLLAAPVVNVLVALTTFVAFRGQDALLMTGLRIGLGYMLAVGVGLIVLKIGKESILNNRMLAQINVENSLNKERPLGEKITAMFHAASHDFMIVGSAFIIGTGIVSLISTGLHYSVLSSVAQSSALSIAVFMALSFILSMCSTSDSFVAASLTQFQPEAKLAFLLIGPLIDLKLLFFYRTMFKARFLWWLSLGLFIAVFVIAYLAGMVIWR